MSPSRRTSSCSMVSTESNSSSTRWISGVVVNMVPIMPTGCDRNRSKTIGIQRNSENFRCDNPRTRFGRQQPGCALTPTRDHPEPPKHTYLSAPFASNHEPANSGGDLTCPQPVTRAAHCLRQQFEPTRRAATKRRLEARHSNGTSPVASNHEPGRRTATERRLIPSEQEPAELYPTGDVAGRATGGLTIRDPGGPES